MTHPPTEAFVRDYATGDGLAYERLYGKLAPALSTWAEFQLAGPLRTVMEPADLLQEVWMRGLQKLHNFDPDVGRFRNWMFGIAKIVLLEAYRSLDDPSAQAGMQGERISQVGQRSAEVTRMVDRLSRDEVHRAMVGSLQQLPRQERRMACLCGLEGMQHAEAAPLLDMKTEAVTKSWQRLRRRLAARHPEWNLWAN